MVGRASRQIFGKLVSARATSALPVSCKSAIFKVRAVGESLRRRCGTAMLAQLPISLIGSSPQKAPNKLWVSDITYVPTSTGFLFVAIVLDVFSRRVVGWAMETHLKTQLVLDALNMAVHQRNPVGVIHHSDQGTQYTSIAFGQRCKEAGVDSFDGIRRRLLRQRGTSKMHRLQLLPIQAPIQYIVYRESSSCRQGCNTWIRRSWLLEPSPKRSTVSP